jgi:arylsulfatase A-like enzyme
VRLPGALRVGGVLEARIVLAGDAADDIHPVAIESRSETPPAIGVELPPGFAGREGALLVRQVPDDTRHDVVRIESPAVSVPPGSVLRFAIAGALDASIRFRVELCDRAVCTPQFEEDLPPGDAWQEREIALAPFDAQSVRFRFVTERTDGGDARIGIWANPKVFVRAEVPRSEDTPSNLVLISLDTLGARHLGAYGSERDTSPFLDDWFGRNGLVVDRLISAEVHTGPAHISLFTSLPPTAHGVHAGKFGRLPYAVDTLASRLREAGLCTGAVTENAAIFVGGGFERGFEEYKELGRQDDERGIRETFAAGRDFIDRHREHRFFLFLHTYETHWRYDPPDAYAGLFDADDAPGAGDDLGDFSSRKYAQEIRFVDDQIRDLVGHVEREGLLADTLIVVTSDHGEAFLEHGEVGHGGQLYGEATEIPLFIAGPGVAQGGRLTGAISQLDLAPTLLDLFGAEPLRDGMGSSFGESIRSGAPPPLRPVFSEAWFGSGRGLGPNGDPHPILHPDPLYSVVWNREKLIRTGLGGESDLEQYLLDADPAERNDVSVRNLPSLAGLSERLAEWDRDSIAKRDELLRRERDVVLDPVPSGLPGLDSERRERLRELGYIE